MSSKPVLVARNAKEEPKEEPGKGIPWEDFVGMEVRMRKEPWRQLEENLGEAYRRAQASQVTTSPTAPGGGTPLTSLPAHTHPLSDVTATRLTIDVIVAVADDGVNLVYKKRSITVPVEAFGAESGWTTFAETVTSCD